MHVQPLKTSRQRIVAFTLVEILIVVLLIGIILAIAAPNFIQAREISRAHDCAVNLHQIDGAKHLYLMVNNASIFTSATSSDSTLGGLVPQYIRSAPTCVAGGTYTTGDSNTLPSCSLAASNAPLYALSSKFPHAIQ